MTPEQFLTKNMKWFALAFFLLFLFKSVQSCNRNMGTRISDKSNYTTIDSLKKDNYIYKDSTRYLNSENKHLNETIKSKDITIEEYRKQIIQKDQQIRDLINAQRRTETIIIREAPDTTKRR